MWNGGMDQIGMGMQGKGKNETNYKRKGKKEKGVLLVYATDLPVRMQGFWVRVVVIKHNELSLIKKSIKTKRTKNRDQK